MAGAFDLERIREMRADGIPDNQIIEALGCSRSTISRAVRISPALTDEARWYRDKQIRALRAQGVSRPKVASIVGCSLATVGRVMGDPDPAPEPPPPPPAPKPPAERPLPPPTTLTDAERTRRNTRIVQLSRDHSWADIAAIVGCSESTIGRVLADTDPEPETAAPLPPPALDTPASLDRTLRMHLRRGTWRTANGAKEFCTVLATAHTNHIHDALGYTTWADYTDDLIVSTDDALPEAVIEMLNYPELAR